MTVRKLRRPAHSREWNVPVVEPLPIWLSALIAARCQARGAGEPSTVRWNCISGRAFYTNECADPVLIQPLGVHLEGGHTLAVSWRPGESDYTMEVYRPHNYFV